MKWSGVVVVAAGGLLGFVSVTVVAGAMRSRPRTGPGVATVEAGPSLPGEAPLRCDPRARLEDLRKIEATLASRIAELTEADGVARFLPPRDLPARFAGPAVKSAVEAAIAGSDLAGRVDEVDCSAYPCLVVGHYASAGQIGRVQRELRGNPEYADDIALVMTMGNDPKGGGALIGAVVFPRKEPRAAEIVAAFRRRRAEVMDKRAAAAPVVPGERE